MFFRSVSPLEQHTASWVERSLAELDDLFGRDPFLRGPMEPTAEFFPDGLDATDASFERIAHRVAALMGIPRARYEIRIRKLESNLYLEDAAGNWSPSGAAGLYYDSSDRAIIELDRSDNMSLQNLIGTCAHEFSHLMLMGNGLIDPNRFDNELLTDLTALYHGFGVFLANSPRACLSQMSNWPGTTIRRPEYMSLPMFGHALAHQAWHRGEDKPPWRKHLRPDARTCLTSSLKWLSKQHESEYRPPAARDKSVQQ